MKFSSATPYFKFSKSQRLGLFALLLGIVVFQLLYFFIDFQKKPDKVDLKQNQWLALPIPKDSVSKYSKNGATKRYPFNPNFITDFKGYKLGMSVAEIDRLLAFRKTNRYVNSAKEFQEVTLVSDSLLRTIAPYFKFPDWVNQRNQKKNSFFKTTLPFKKEPKPILDINLATAEDLKKVYGIGDGLSARILKEKEKFGGFVSMDQLEDVWGLSPEVIEKINESFAVKGIPDLEKLNINKANMKELMRFPYFRYPLAKAIVTFRSMNGEIKNTADLAKISGFPVDKINIIALYLEF